MISVVGGERPSVDWGGEIGSDGVLGVDNPPRMGARLLDSQLAICGVLVGDIFAARQSVEAGVV
jgi:hypothetical protein